ncbi:MAG: AMP-binding protein [Burkholderiales bacterium]|nr:AMP-binding protein [Burkholderiales bacterium]MDE2502310.1 AMP-binding protein [Burkholderiales bacterium]
MPESQFKSYRAGDLQWSDAPLWSQFESLLQADADALALVGTDQSRWTRAQIARMARAAADHLAAQGIGAGDRVLVQAYKTAQTAAAALAISKLGAIFCPYSPDFGRAEREVLMQRLGHVATIDSTAAAPIPGLAGLGLRLHDRAALPPRDARDAGTALIGFTSGTTGIPKGVMHGSAAMNYATRACARIAGLEPGEAIASVVPLASAAGFTFGIHMAFTLGQCAVLIEPWEPMAALRTMEDNHCRWAMCVPTQLAAMIECARAGQWQRPSPLRALAVGGSAMTPELVSDAERLLGLTALRMFGMSECMGHASTLPTDPMAVRRLHDGHPFPGTEDLAFDADLQPLPPGARGQAGVRGPSLFLGYCRGLGDQDARYTPQGHFLTGDEIIREPDGLIRVVGRIKDQIIRGGFNIDPAEVEAALLQHPAIAAVAVVAVPESRLGEQACAVCQLRGTAPAPSLDDLKRHLEAVGLSKKKWPEHLLVVPELPQTSTGKVDKKQLARVAGAAVGAR